MYTCVCVCVYQGSSSSGNNPSGSDSDVSLCTATKLSSQCAFLSIKNASILKTFSLDFCFGFSSWFFFKVYILGDEPVGGAPLRAVTEVHCSGLLQYTLFFSSPLPPLFAPTHHLFCVCFVLSTFWGSHGSLLWKSVVVREWRVAWLLFSVAATDLWNAVNGNVVRRKGGEMMLTVYGSLITCHWTTWKECFAKENLYIFINDAI